MININDVRSGMCIKYNDSLYLVLDQQHVKPGKGSAFVRTKLKNVHTGANIDVTFNAGIKVEKAILNKKEMQYLYNSGNDYIFMDMEDYSQIEVKKETLGNTVNYLKENLEIIMQFHNSDIVGIILPDKISFKVTSTEQAVKGNTSSGAMKDAIIETGLNVKVPIFISEGEEIIVSTEDGKYVSRA